MTTGTTGIEALDRGIQEFNGWIKDIADRLATPERHLALRALRAVLHALRDRMGPDNAANFAAHLPPLIRAIFFEGYRPSTHPAREKSRGAFLEQVHDEGVQPLDIEELERSAKAVLAVMGARLDPGQMEKLAALFPEEFSDLWPETPLEWDAPLKARSQEARQAIATSRAQRPSQGSRSVRALTGLDDVDLAIHAATQWIDALEFRMNTQISRASWSALSATLQAIREQLDADAATAFAAHLPLPLQGIYYEGWKPASATPVQTRSGFLQRIELTAWHGQDISVERGVKAAMEVISRKVPAAQMAPVVAALPRDFSALWPDEPAPYADLRESRPIAEQVAPPQPPARAAKNVRRAHNRAPGQTTRNAIAAPKPGKRAH